MARGGVGVGGGGRVVGSQGRCGGRGWGRVVGSQGQCGGRGWGRVVGSQGRCGGRGWGGSRGGGRNNINSSQTAPSPSASIYRLERRSANSGPRAK